MASPNGILQTCVHCLSHLSRQAGAAAFILAHKGSEQAVLPFIDHSQEWSPCT